MVVLKISKGKSRLCSSLLLLIVVLACIFLVSAFNESFDSSLEVSGFPLELKNSQGENLEFEVRVIEVASGGFSVSSSSLPVVEIDVSSGPVKKLVFDNLDLEVGGELGIDDVGEDIDAPKGEWAKVYAIDPEGLEFDSAVVSVVATGSKLYKCKDWVFNEQRCDGDWVFFKDVVPGQEYSFVLTRDDPGFGEIIAIDAIYYNSDGEEVENIYDDVVIVDDSWSPAVYENEFVRVTFEDDLNNGNVIDVVVRSNGTLAYFDVYELGGQHVGKSGIAGMDGEILYVILDNLTEPGRVFDLKIRKVYYEEEDESSRVDPDVDSFLEFDYIHDDYINFTQADGFLVYQELDTSVPRYRTWNESNVFSSELVDASSIGADISWVITKGNHERDEMIVGTLDKDNDVNIQIYDGSWGNLLEVSSDVSNSAYRSFDIEYEQVSGEALIVYESSSTSDALVYYRTWDGYSYSGKLSISITSLSNSINWVSLVHKDGGDEMMLLVHDSSTNLFAIPWDGDSFDLGSQAILTSSSSSATEEHFAFEWEGNSGDGFAVFSEGTNWVWKSYDSSGGTWSSGISEDILNGLDAVRMCSDSNSDYIGIIFQDSGSDVGVRMWNGTEILSGSPSEDTSTEIHGLNGANFDCAWDVSGDFALFGFADRNVDYMDYFNFTKTGNVWSTSNLETTTDVTESIASDDIKAIRFNRHPMTGEIMILFADLLETISLLRWNGSVFLNISASPVEISTEVLNGDQEGAMFDWYRYDPTPFVNTPELTDGEEYNALASVEITVEVTDNIEVDRVWATVTLPDDSSRDYFLADEDNDSTYNFTFLNTSLAGYYEVEIFANDTSVYQNLNEEEATEFTVNEATPPAVFSLLPSLESSYNVSDIIEISADATDASSVSSVFANVTYPNSTVVQVSLQNSVGDKYNASFIVPALIGDYDVVFVATDSVSNINSTESTNFSVVDDSPPVISGFSCLPASLSLGEIVVCNVSVIDNFLIDVVSGIITYFNGTNVSVLVSNVSSNYYFSFSGTSVSGMYNVTWTANDTSGNVGNNLGSFFVGDNVAPTVEPLLPTSDGVYNVSDVIEIAANIIDGSSVSFVYANVTYPNGTVFEVVLSHSVGDKYNGSFVVPILIGNYNISFFANDTSANINDSVFSNFSVTDTIAPVVTNLGCSPGILNPSQNVVCNVSVSDDVGVDSAFANVTYPNGTVIFVGMNNVSDNYYFSFSGTDKIGQFNVSFVVNDTSGNDGFNSSSFLVNDIVAPGVVLVSPSFDSEYYVFDSIEIAVNVSDDLEVDFVYANVTYPNGTVFGVVLNNSIGDKYNVSFVSPALLGNYNISFFSNDTSNNLNDSVFSNFSVADDVEPDVAVVSPFSGRSFLENSSVNIAANISDEIEVFVVYADVTFPNTTTIRIEMLDLDVDGIYNVSFNQTSEIGTYQFNIYTNDTSGNFNDAENSNFNIQEASEPLVTLISPSNGVDLSMNNVTFVCSAVDIGGLVNISLYHDISQPFGFHESRNVSGTSNQSTFVINGVPDGSYDWNCLVGDITGNQVFAGANYNFNLDTVSPTISVGSPLGGVYNISNSMEISADIVDSNIISTVFANVTYSNGTVFQVSMNPAVGNTYTGFFSIPALLGSYNVTYIAMDLVGNINDSVFSNFSVADVVGPSIQDLGCSPVDVNLSRSVVCNVSVSDEIAVSNVFANVTYPDGTNVSVSVFNISDNYYFNFSDTDQIGQFNVSWFSNDSSGNFGFNSSLFLVNDVVPPSVSLFLPLLDSLYNISNVIEIAADLIDDVSTSNAFANVTYPNGTILEVVLNNFLGNKYNGSFVAPALIGSYDIVFVANDSSGNINDSVISNFSVADVVGPVVSFLIPVADSIYNVTNVIEIAADAVDEIAVDYVYANVTYPNGTVLEVVLGNFAGNKYNGSFVAPALIGNYALSYFANDSSGNIDLNGFSNFNVDDIVAPVVTNLGCSPGILNLSQNVVCNVSVSDDVGVDSAFANVTYPNGTVVFVGMNNVSDNYYFSFSGVSKLGQYNVTFVVNDSGGNIGLNSSSFFANDVVAPIVSLIDPVYNYNMSASVNLIDYFNFSISDDNGEAVNCSLYVDSLFNQSNISVLDGSFTLFDFYNYSIGVHNWSVECSDVSGNFNSSEVWNFTVDNDVPNFITLVTDPNSVDGLDPGVNITVFADVTDNSSLVDVVLLQYKLFDESTYSNISMNFNNVSGYYVAILNVSEIGIYNLRLFANDSVGNSGFSSVINKTMDFEYSWTTSPASSFSPVSANLSDDIVFGELVIDNTGDYNLDFLIFSDSAETVYNATENFSLSSGEVKTLLVNDSATDAGVKMVNFNVSASFSGEDYGSKIITGAIIVAPGQPVLVSRFLDPANGVLSTTQGATGVNFNVELENAGEGDAYNVSLSYDLPAGWIVTFGSGTMVFDDDFLSEDSAENAIELTVPSNTPVGDYVVSVSVVAVNSSGGDMVEAGLVFNDYVTVSVLASQSFVGGGGGGGSVSPPVVATPSGGGGSGQKVDGVGSETIYTTERLSVIRGTTELLPITITNFYENTYFKDLTLEMRGFLTQYVKVTSDFDPEKLVFIESENLRLFVPGVLVSFNLTGIGVHSVSLSSLENDSADFMIYSDPINVSLNAKESKELDLSGDGVLDSAITLWSITDGVVQVFIHKLGFAQENRLYFLEERNYTLEVFAPPYLEKKDYEVTLDIAAELVAQDPVAAGFSSKPFLEQRTLIFSLLERSNTEAKTGLSDAEESIRWMKELNFSVGEVEDLFREAEVAFEKLNYERTLELTNAILDISKAAFESNDLINVLKIGIEGARERMLGVEDSEADLLLATKAFERGDYETALERARAAELTFILETKGRISWLWVIINFWWLMIISAFILFFVLFTIYKNSYMFIISKRLKNITKEEVSINALMDEAQVEYLTKGSLSPGRYKQVIAEYEKRLNDLRNLRVKLRHRRVGILRTAQEVKNLEKEREELKLLIKKTQDDYFNRHKLTERKFKNLYNLEKERLVEVDEQRMVMDEKLLKQKNTRVHRALVFLNKVDKKINEFFVVMMEKLERMRK